MNLQNCKTPYNKLRRVRKGFTLIEILVVIAIMAILAAILFPVFARARENARRASCMSNMKQIGLGIMQYVQDYDEHYPLTWYGRVPGGGAGYIQTTPGTPGTAFEICDPSSCAAGTLNSAGEGHFFTWMDLIYPYVESTQVFVCPSSTNPVELGSKIPNYWMSGAYGNTVATSLDSTTQSDYATAAYGQPILTTGTPVAAITRPSQSVMVFEASGSRTVLYLIRGNPGALVDPGWDVFFRTHLDGINLTFGDGHVKWMSYNNIAAQIGPYSTSSCNLSAINASLPNCSTLWNPFLPQ